MRLFNDPSFTSNDVEWHTLSIWKNEYRLVFIKKTFQLNKVIKQCMTLLTYFNLFLKKIGPNIFNEKWPKMVILSFEANFIFQKVETLFTKFDK